MVEFPRSRARARKHGKRRIRLWPRRKRKKRFKVRKLRVRSCCSSSASWPPDLDRVRDVHCASPRTCRSSRTPRTRRSSPSSLDKHGDEIGFLTGNERRIYLREDPDRPDFMKQAMVAIEDRRFWTNSGVDVRGIARAAFQNTGRGPAGSPGRVHHPAAVHQDLARGRERPHDVPEAARGRARLPADAPVVEGPHPAQLPEHDLLRQRRLRDRVGRATYFAYNHDGASRPAAPRCCSRTRRRCSRGSSPRRARTTRPSTPSPRASAVTWCSCACSSRATSRGVTRAEGRGRPDADDLTYPKEDTKFPYFTSWIKQQVVDQLGGGQQGARFAFDGGLQVKTTIDSKLQTAAAEGHQGLAAERDRAAGLPRGDLQQGRHGPCDGGRRRLALRPQPFNLATQGQRQPGSAFKPFVLAARSKRASARTRPGRRRS